MTTVQGDGVHVCGFFLGGGGKRECLLQIGHATLDNVGATVSRVVSNGSINEGHLRMTLLMQSCCCRLEGLLSRWCVIYDILLTTSCLQRVSVRDLPLSDT